MSSSVPVSASNPLSLSVRGDIASSRVVDAEIFDESRLPMTIAVAYYLGLAVVALTHVVCSELRGNPQSTAERFLAISRAAFALAGLLIGALGYVSHSLPLLAGGAVIYAAFVGLQISSLLAIRRAADAQPAHFGVARDEPGWSNIRVDRRNVREQPRGVLRRLSTILFPRGLGPSIGGLTVHFVNQNVQEPATDAGGPRRELWTELGSYVFKSGADPNFLPARETGEGWVPDLRVIRLQIERENERRREVAGTDYRRLGRILSWGRRHELLFPPVFAPQFFMALRAHLNAEFARVGILGAYGQLGDSACFPSRAHRTRDEWEFLAQRYLALREDAGDYMSWSQEWEAKPLASRIQDLEQPGVLGRLVQWIQQDVKGIEEAVAEIVTGIGHDVGNQGLGLLADRSLVQLGNAFCGETSADFLIRRVECADADHLQWLRNWIRVSSAEQRRQFIRAATGAASLAPGDSISMVVQAQALMESHTCGRWFTIQRQQDEQSFGEVLSLWSVAEGSGLNQFNLA